MSEDPFAIQRQLWNRWLETLSLTADATLRSQGFLLWMQYCIKTAVEVQRLQRWWFPRPARVDQSTSAFP